ncbi:MAG: deoxyribodipyrimidine photo-lyase [Bryobacterales bacterium]|nr:deoxyribodipyrimidine photo-lyase [Bryobacterales bacterium]
MSVQLVWFKRDLRVRDHQPLLEASAHGQVLPLYIIEPSVLESPDFDPCHWTFLRRSLEDLRDALAKLGAPLVVRVGEAVDIFRALHERHCVDTIWAHEETGNAVTYARDRAVLEWARASGVAFRESPSNGVVRRLGSRDGWSKRWEQRMSAPIAVTPSILQPIAIDPGHLPSHAELGLGADRKHLAQRGGEAAAHTLLESFLAGRGSRYHMEMSSPVTAFESCSRLSSHLAYGTISTRQVVQALRKQIAFTTDSQVKRALRAFDGRLHWRCHFMQKLEDEPAIEHQNFVRAFDGMRENEFRRDWLDAWREGRTGYPMVDACMRCLHETGWINFRMRAMLMSFAAYHLWLHWREPGLHLARMFVDYEPGIHWSQSQMQSGTTGINTLRIYNPSKQLLDHDPAGVFVRRWLPELRDMPAEYIAEPWKFASRMNAYPHPVVDHQTAVRAARQRLSQFRRSVEVRAESREVAAKHGSRKGSSRQRSAQKRA